MNIKFWTRTKPKPPPREPIIVVNRTPIGWPPGTVHNAYKYPSKIIKITSPARSMPMSGNVKTNGRRNMSPVRNPIGMAHAIARGTCRTGLRTSSHILATVTGYIIIFMYCFTTDISTHSSQWLSRHMLHAPGRQTSVLYFTIINMDLFYLAEMVLIITNDDN